MSSSIGGCGSTPHNTFQFQFAKFLNDKLKISKTVLESIFKSVFLQYENHPNIHLDGDLKKKVWKDLSGSYLNQLKETFIHEFGKALSVEFAAPEINEMMVERAQNPVMERYVQRIQTALSAKEEEIKATITAKANSFSTLRQEITDAIEASDMPELIYE